MATKLLNLQAFPDDDVSFLSGFCGLASDLVQRWKPREVFVVRIDNWFDVKWFGFSGKAKVAIDTGIPFINSEVQPFWKTGSNVTFPPFVPNRILAQFHYRYEDSSLVQSIDDARCVHSGDKQRSDKNLHNRVLEFSPSAMYFWFSSKSSVNGRATMMCYHAHEGALSASWYVSLVRGKVWGIDRCRNMEKDVLERHFQVEVAKETT